VIGPGGRSESGRLHLRRGWLPGYRPRGVSPLSKRTLAYTRMRRKAKSSANKQAHSTGPVNTEIVLFDHGPAEFPVASMRPRETRGRIVAAVASLQAWLVARWQWLRPRSVPCAVAALGMIAVLAAANYLAHYQGACSHDAPAAAVYIEIAHG